MTPVENLLRAATEKEYLWFAMNTPLLHAMTGHKVPGWILPFRFLPKPRPKRRRKTSDVSGLPLSPRLGWGQGSRDIFGLPPHRIRGEKRKRA
ncbi:conserved hypothetical protein [Rhizobium mesoamericanum STM3625]|uniref:Uncharacterized protein n=1 Tax=Rhizobium mesoamericanum STM3625 TaxID=1211777 RepID=K0PVK9_9HYPH|nr:conserved hypothetical protein [Rhizobium mesoamericanum STM3625]